MANISPCKQHVSLCLSEIHRRRYKDTLMMSPVTALLETETDGIGNDIWTSWSRACGCARDWLRHSCRVWDQRPFAGLLCGGGCEAKEKCLGWCRCCAPRAARSSPRSAWYWCLLFVLIRHGLRGGSGPQCLIRALGEETGNPIMAFHRPSFFPSVERAPHHTTTENLLLGGDPSS
jgi:hypothetical protein